MKAKIRLLASKSIFNSNLSIYKNFKKNISKLSNRREPNHTKVYLRFELVSFKMDRVQLSIPISPRPCGNCKKSKLCPYVSRYSVDTQWCCVVS